LGERWREIWRIFKGTFADGPPEPEEQAQTADAALDAAGQWMALFRGRAPWLAEGGEGFLKPRRICEQV